MVNKDEYIIYMFPRYLRCLLDDFCQVLLLVRLGTKDELIRFWAQKAIYIQHIYYDIFY